MSTEAPSHDRGPVSHEEFMSALFAQLIMQNTNMAMMFLGQMPNPETNEQMQDLDAARLFIDQLEMIEVKTKGNLNRHEEQLLKQSLMNLRLAYVHATEHPLDQTQERPTVAAGPNQTQVQPSAGAEPEAPAADESSGRKKFSKRYGG